MRMDDFLTVNEEAATLKLNPQTVRNWIDRGELPAVRVGARRVRIKREDFERLVQRPHHALSSFGASGARAGHGL
jgi:excisionase family DNA binding protein